MTQSLDLESEQDELFPGERRARPGIDTSQRVPGKREVDLYVRTYTTLLQSTGAIPVSSLIPAHLTAASSLHAGAAEPEPDLNAFMYSAQRLPDCIVDVTDIVLGQSARGFDAPVTPGWTDGRSPQPPDGVGAGDMTAIERLRRLSLRRRISTTSSPRSWHTRSSGTRCTPSLTATLTCGRSLRERRPVNISMTTRSHW